MAQGARGGGRRDVRVAPGRVGVGRDSGGAVGVRIGLPAADDRCPAVSWHDDVQCELRVGHAIPHLAGWAQWPRDEISREEFYTLLRPWVPTIRGVGHAVRRVQSDDGYWVAYETFCGDLVLSLRRDDPPAIGWPWDGESYSGCELCIIGALEAPPLARSELTSRKRLSRRLRTAA